MITYLSGAWSSKVPLTRCMRYCSFYNLHGTNREASSKPHSNSLRTIPTILLKWNSRPKCGIQIVKLILFNYCSVYPDGKVCISILHPPGTDAMNSQESADERWRPILGVEAIIVSVISMLNSPNIESPANLDAALDYRDNGEGYKKKVRKLTQ